MEKKNDTLLGTLASLEIGDSETFPVKRLNSVRSACSAFGLQWGKRFTANIHRDSMTVKVTRIQ